VRHSTLSQFDARTPVLGDHVAANIWLTMHSHAQDAVITALADVITPNERRRVGRFVVSDHFHTFFERLLDGVIDDAGLIVVDLNTILVQDHFITVNLLTATISWRVALTLHSTSRLIRIAVA
jgi:hypothetical protein